MLKISEIRDKSTEDLNLEVEKAYKEKLYVKGIRALGNVKNIYEYKKSKKLIAQIKTVLNERKKLHKNNKIENKDINDQKSDTKN